MASYTRTPPLTRRSGEFEREASSVRSESSTPNLACSGRVTPRLGDAAQAPYVVLQDGLRVRVRGGHWDGHRLVAALTLLHRSSQARSACQRDHWPYRAELQQGGQESNLQPPVLETGALPIELPPLVHRILSACSGGAPSPGALWQSTRTAGIHSRCGSQESSTPAWRAVCGAGGMLRRHRRLVGARPAMDHPRGVDRHRWLDGRALLPLTEVKL